MRLRLIRFIFSFVLVACAIIGAVIAIKQCSSDTGQGSKFGISGVFPIDVYDAVNLSNVIVFPDEGSLEDGLDEEFQYGFAVRLYMKNTGKNNLSFNKITIHAENIKVNLSPCLTGFTGVYFDNGVTTTTSYLCGLKNEGWHIAEDVKLFFEISKNDGDEPDVDKVFDWSVKQIDVGDMLPGQNQSYEYLKAEEINQGLLDEQVDYYNIDVFYSKNSINKTCLYSDIIPIYIEPFYDPDSGGGLPDKREGGYFSAVMTIPISAAEYSKDYYPIDLIDSQIEANDSEYFSFIVFPEKSCEFDFWFEIELQDGTIMRTKTLKNIKVNVPYYENEDFLNIDGSDPDKIDFSKLYGDSTADYHTVN